MKNSIHGKPISRRDVVKASALTGIAASSALALPLAGPTKALADEGLEEWDESFDIVIIGSGLAGLSAAATVITEGEGASCLLIEKGDTCLGCSPYSAGQVLFTESVDECYEYLRALSGSNEYQVTPDDVLKVFAEGIAENLGWVYSLGIPEEEIAAKTVDTDEEATGITPFVPEWPEFTGADKVGSFGVNTKYEGNHAHIWNLFDAFVSGHPDAVEYRHNCTFEELIVGAGGEIVGVVANGSRIQANKGVIMCCGGFESNPEMLQDYLGQGRAINAGGTGNTGDGHKACWKIGAGFWHMDHYAGPWEGGRNIEDTLWSNAQNSTNKYKKYGITVGVNGLRFYNDADGHKLADDDAKVGDTFETLAEHVGFRHGASQFGGEWRFLPLPSKAWFIFDQNGLDSGAFNLDMSDDPVGDGWLYTAETIEDLAAQISVPAEALKETIDIWNQSCEQGVDTAFRRQKSTLIKIENPPYFAQLCRPSFLNTDGGPRRDSHSRILDVDGNPIPNLYSAGEFGSVWGLHYQGTGNLAECMVFSRIAVREILSTQ